MARKKDDWLVPAILFTGSVVFFLSRAAAAAPKPPSNVQTAVVGDRLYSVTRLGQGNYIVTLVSTGGTFESEPVNFAFSQSGQLGAVGSAQKLAQLKTDMQSFNVDFRA